MQSLPKLLLIEDDPGISAALLEALRTTYDTEHATTGKQGIYKTDLENFAAIVLDLNLPDLPGVIICQQLRERGVNAPILVLTGEDKVLTKINLLDAGANDYLTKPFSLGELKARLRSLTRSYDRPSRTTILKVHDILLNTVTHEVTRAGKPIQLRRKEFSILECLMVHAGSVVPRKALLRYAWSLSDDAWTNTIDVHIKYLRDKIDRPFAPPLIKTVHGVGYKINSDVPTVVKTNVLTK